MTSEQKGTPCEQLGYKRGDVFEAIENGICCFYYKGDKMILEEDDGSACPYFLSPKYSNIVSCRLSNLKKIENVPPKTLDDAFGELGGTGIDFNLSSNKYVRNIRGVDVDVYDILKAWNVTCPAIQHVIKKLLMPGQRGHKSKANDLEEAHAAIQRAIELEVF